MPVVRRALVALVLLAAALVVPAGAAQAVAPPPACGGTNIARNGHASASSVQNQLYPPSNAIDGNPNTRWASAFGEPQWITIDLGSAYSVCRVVLDWDFEYAKAFQLQMSNDGVSWYSIFSTTAGAGGIQSINVAGAGRYIRMLGTVRATAWGMSLWEFEVYSVPPPSCGTQNAALGRPVTASSQESASFAPSRAVDGNTATRWSSQFSDPQWIAVYLGAAQTVCRVVLAWEAAYATAYQVQFSLDGQSWNTAYATATGTGGTQSIDVVGNARYVRMYGTARATRYCYSLFEFQVFSRLVA